MDLKHVYQSAGQFFITVNIEGVFKKVEDCPIYAKVKKKDASGASAQRASFFAVRQSRWGDITPS